MKFFKSNNSEQHKLSKKDIAIIILSAILLILLMVIVIISRNRDRMIAESLQRNSNIATDEAIANLNSSSMDSLEITEISSDKWIEIHNTGIDAIDISGLQFNISGKADKTIEDGVVIKKESYYVVELDNNPGKEDQNVLTINDESGNVIKTLLVPKIDEDKTYGIADAEKNIWGYMKPTKGKANKTKDIQYLERGGIAISAPGGFYNGGFELELLCNEDEKIYYTTDGSKPTTESTEYETAINVVNQSGSKYVYAREAIYNRLHSDYMPGTVDAGMIVRAIKVNSAGSVIGEMNEAYYIGLTKDSDYLNIPVISITTEPENLFGYEDGIYVAGKANEDALIQGLKGEYYANYYNTWSKPAKIEYYENTKDKSFEVDAEIYINPDMSVASRQKSFVINLENTKYSNFNGSSLLNFVSSDGKVRLTTNYEDNELKVRNLLADTLAEGTDIGVLTYQPCVLFLEGEYWGLYTLSTYSDSKYIEEKYDLKGQEIIIHEPGNEDESFKTFYNTVTRMNLSADENYEKVKSMMDIDNYIDYICFNVFLGNSNFWPVNGTAWRTATEGGKGKADGKWRFLSGDLSNTMYLSTLQTPTINTFLQQGIQADLLFQTLLMNDEFCEKLQSRMNTLVNEVFDAEKCDESLDALDKLLRKPAVASRTRFSAGYSENQYSEGMEIIKIFFEERPDYAVNYAQELAKKGGNIAKAREMLEEIEEKKKKEAELAGETVDTDEGVENTEETEVDQTAGEDAGDASVTGTAIENTVPANAGEEVPLEEQEIIYEETEN